MRFIAIAGFISVITVNALTACSLDRLFCSKPVQFVGISGPYDPHYPTVLWIGDSISMSAGAGLDPSEEFCPQDETMYTSSSNPDRFTWLSSDTTIVAIDASGRVVARGVGTATIRARSAGITSRDPYFVRVVPPLSRVTFTADPPVGVVGSSTTVRVKAVGLDGETVDDPGVSALTLTSPTGISLSWTEGSANAIERTFTPRESGEYFIRTEVLRSFKPSWTIQLQYVVK